ncbi:MAG TPA: hypothetical protein VMS17_31545 [Gemmataceae bacterium]|nr:hypothetical protein [Gemmataceae bacterium]
MPITVRCPKCNALAAAPDAAAGARVKCPQCGEAVSVPRQAGPTPDWLAAPPPVRRPAPTPVSTTAAASGPAEAPPSGASAGPPPPADPIRDDEPEPWYYRYIERYVISAIWIGLGLIALSFMVTTVLFVVAGAWTTSTSSMPIGNTAAAGCVGFLYWLYLAVMHVAAAFLLVYICSWLLLALDGARNLRRIRIKLPGG